MLFTILIKITFVDLCFDTALKGKGIVDQGLWDGQHFLWHCTDANLGCNESVVILVVNLTVVHIF